jgi:EpsI family protein
VIKLLAAIGFLGLNLYTYYFMARDAVIPPRESFDEFPMDFGPWHCAERGSLSEGVLRNLGATDYLICDYERHKPAGFVSVYLGYHATQIREEGGGSGENSIHPPAHCLPGSGWDIIENRVVRLSLPGMPVRNAPVRRLVIAKGQARQLVYYWYQSRGRVIAEDWKKIVYMGWDRAIRHRTDGSLVRFTVPIIRDDVDAAEEQFRDLAPQIVALLPKRVPV